jgi:hypothetical protein
LELDVVIKHRIILNYILFFLRPRVLRSDNSLKKKTVNKIVYFALRVSSEKLTQIIQGVSEIRVLILTSERTR